MLKNNGLINYVLDFGGKFLFLFDLKKGLTIKMEYLEILPKYVHKKFSSLQGLLSVMESYRLICGNHNSYRNCSILLLSIRHLGISQEVP